MCTTLLFGMDLFQHFWALFADPLWSVSYFARHRILLLCTCRLPANMPCRFHWVWLVLGTLWLSGFVKLGRGRTLQGWTWKVPEGHDTLAIGQRSFEQSSVLHGGPIFHFTRKMEWINRCALASVIQNSDFEQNMYNALINEQTY